MLRRLIAVLAVLSLLPLVAAALQQGASAAPPAAAKAPQHGPARPRSRRTRRPSGRPSTASRTSPAKTFGDLGYGSGYMAADASLCTLVDTLITGRGERSLWFGQNARYDDQVTLAGVEPAGRRVRHRPAQPPGRREAARRQGQRSRQRGAGDGRAATSPAPTAGCSDNKVTDPACQDDAYLADKAAGLGTVTELDLWYGVYMANLLASSGVFVKEIVDATPPSPTDPGIPDPGDLPVSAADLTAAQKAAILKGLGRDPERPFGSNATAVGGDRHHDRARHDPGQPALPVARSLPLHPAAPDDPGQVRRRRRLADRLAGGQHRLEQATSRGATPSPRPTASRRTSTAWSARRRYLTDSGPQSRSSTGRSTVKVRKADGSIGTVDEDLWRTERGLRRRSPRRR